MPVIATVTPAARRGMTTPERFRVVNDDGGAGDAELLARIGRATATIERYLGRILAQERVRELISGIGLRNLVLERSPLLEVHGITVNGQAVDAGAITLLDPRAAIVALETRFDPWADDCLPTSQIAYGWRQGRGEASRYEVDYTGGWTMPDDAGSAFTLPADLEDACQMLVRGELEQRQRALGVTSERLGDYSVSYAQVQGGQGAAMAAVAPVLDRYRPVLP